MYSILVIDDEPLIRLGLRKSLKWEDYGFYIKDDVECADDALELLKNNKYDVIITDIRMPETDGLKFIEVVKKENINSYFVIISGYDEFEYAKKAIELKVFGYLLKPIQKNELIQLMTKLKKQLDEDKKSGELNNIKTALIKEKIFRELISQQFITENGKKNGNSARNLVNEDFIKYFKCKSNRIIIIIETNWDINEDTFDNISNMIYRLKGCETVIKDFELRKYIILFNSFLSNEEFIDIKLFVSELKELMKLFELLFTISVGNEVDCPEKFYISYKTAEMNIKNMFYDKNAKEICFPVENILFCNRSEVSYHKLNEITTIITNALINNKESEINELIDELFSVLTVQYTIEPGEVFELVYETLLSISYDLTKKIGVEINVRRFDHELKRKYNTIEKIKQYFIVKMYEFKSSYFAYADRISSKIISRIKEYIEENLDKKISLQDIAEQFYFNPSYISQLFKKECKMNYSHYLLKVRMEKAMDLLKTSNLKIYEIAAMVGYDDSKQFAKAFKRFFGILPSSLR